MFRKLPSLIAGLLFAFSAFATDIIENFETADGLTGWVVEQGAADESGGHMRVTTAGFVDNIAIHQTSVGAADQYIKACLGTADAQYPLPLFRFTNDASEFYGFYLDGNSGAVDWTHFASVGGATTALGSGTYSSAFTSGADCFAVTIEGTGTATVLRFWKNPTANSPTAADMWDASGPVFSITTDPSNAVDSGNLVGIGATQGTVNFIQYEDFWAGSIGGGGGGGVIVNPITGRGGAAAQPIH